jgi:hypothetical protein
MEDESPRLTDGRHKQRNLVKPLLALSFFIILDRGRYVPISPAVLVVEVF